MTSFQLSQVKQGTLGNDAGWALQFFRIDASGGIGSDPALELSSSDYYASIDATLPEGLAGGTYTITIEGLTDEHYAKIKPADDSVRMAVKLYLFWRDVASVAGYFTNLLGVNAAPSAADLQQSLTAVLYMKKVSRKLGSKVYVAEIQAQELAFWQLTSKRVAETFSAETFSDAIHQIGQRTSASFATWEVQPDGHMTPSQGDAAGSEHVEFGHGLQYSAAVQRLANALEEGLALYGRKMVLIRDGTVHVGKRPIPYPEGPAKRLSYATGLLETVEDEAADPDPNASPDGDGGPSNRQPTFTMTCKGRPDLKPGDVIEFDRPVIDDSKLTPGLGEALAGAFAAPFLPSLNDDFAHDTLMYVTSVQHKLGKAAGFATFVKGVKIPSLADPWDHRTGDTSAPSPSESGPSASAGTTAAAAVRRVAAAATGSNRGLEVAEVRSFASSASGAVEPPSQTETLWAGTAARDGRPNGARRLAIARTQPSSLSGAAYLTPFAWGKCGLVLPRYPGTRVAVGFRNGQADDPIELGAIWQSGHGPVSQPGDYWLSLPVDVDGNSRSSVADSTQAPQEHTGKITQDLIDATGRRFVEVGELTIRVGKAALKSAGTRPSDSSDADSITIEHTKEHSKIVMKQDGSIEITGKNVTIDAGANGTITLKAKNVDVQVQQDMNVH